VVQAGEEVKAITKTAIQGGSQLDGLELHLARTKQKNQSNTSCSGFEMYRKLNLAADSGSVLPGWETPS